MKKNISLVLVIVILSSYNNIDFSRANDVKRIDTPIDIQFSNSRISQKNKPTKNFKELSSESSLSSGQYSISLGLSNKSIKDFSFTSGMENTASARFSQAHGRKSQVKSDFSYAYGDSSEAIGFHSYAHGKRNSSSGLFSYSFGKDNKSEGNHSLTIGRRNTAGDYAFAFGSENSLKGTNSAAIGKNNQVVSDNSYALGANNAIHGNDSYSLGSNNELYSEKSYAFGTNIVSGAANNFTIGNSKSKIYNNIANSFMVGFNSNIPTLFVSSSYGDGLTGTVGIGTHDVNKTTSLHIKGSILIDDGSQKENYILSSDENGKARWTSPKEIGILVKDKETKSREKYVDGLHKKIKTTEENDIAIGFDEERPPAVYVDNEVEYNPETQKSTYSSNVGIGTSNPQQSLHIAGAMRLEPQEKAPSKASAGDIYYDKSGAFCGYIIDSYGYGSWERMIGSGDCNS